MATPLEDLIARLAARPEHVLVIVGSGVAIAATRHAPVASWGGLLEHGIQYCLEHLHQSEKWAHLRCDQLKENEIIEVASAISQKLGAPNSGLYACWLQETLGKLASSEPRLIRALGTWGAPVATTNYDTLIDTGGWPGHNLRAPVCFRGRQLREIRPPRKSRVRMEPRKKSRPRSPFDAGIRREGVGSNGKTDPMLAQNGQPNENDARDKGGTTAHRDRHVVC